MGPRRMVGMVAAWVALAGAEPALGASVYGFDDGFDAPDVTVSDPRGRSDRLTVRVTRHVITVRAAGGEALGARGTCRSVDRQTVRCPNDQYLYEIKVFGGEGNDRVTAVNRGRRFARVIVKGGPGDDRLTARYGDTAFDGGRGSDLLRGGPGSDELTGGPGRDRLAGASGDDVLSGDGVPGQVAAADRLDGGAGQDRAVWAERRTPVWANLEAGRGGSDRSLDRLRRIEDLQGGSGRDVLRGDGGPNELLGGDGADRLHGRGGDDRLGAGTTSYEGGNDDARDRLACGRGRDVILDAGIYVRRFGYAEALPRACEGLDRSDDTAVYYGEIRVRPRKLSRRRIALGVICPQNQPTCRRRVTLLHGSRVLARGTRRADHRFRTVVLRLRRALPRRGVLTVRAIGNDLTGAANGYRYTYRVRR